MMLYGSLGEGRVVSTVSGRPRGERAKSKVLIVSTHLRRDRTTEPPRDLLQPITGLHIAAMLDPNHYEVDLVNESWSGPCRSDRRCYDVVFLTGTQADFDRMRQLSYHFRRHGAKTIAGGSICTLFPRFAARFFDAVCVGTVEAAAKAIRDLEQGELREIYVSQGLTQTDYAIDHAPFERAGIRVPYHLIEASRGCKFKCDFCVIPAEKANKARYDLTKLRQSIDDSINRAPWWSLRRRYPLIWFLDNNFADDPGYLEALLELLEEHPKVRAWGALITQNVLRDHALMDRMRAAGCRAIFAGIESDDVEFLKAHNKTQNLSKHRTVWADIKRAEGQGIAVSYGFLFDPMLADVAEMAEQVSALATDPLLPFPAFFSFIIPLAGTGFFWTCARERRLAGNLRLRDLDGQTVAFTSTRSAPAELSKFAATLFRDLPALVPRRRLLWGILRRAIRVGRWNPVLWAVVFSGTYRMLWMRGPGSGPARSFLAGQDPLDPQYGWMPADITDVDRERYFDPVYVTKPDGQLMDWVLAEMPVSRKVLNRGTEWGSDRCPSEGDTLRSGGM